MAKIIEFVGEIKKNNLFQKSAKIILIQNQNKIILLDIENITIINGELILDDHQILIYGDNNYQLDGIQKLTTNLDFDVSKTIAPNPQVVAPKLKKELRVRDQLFENLNVLDPDLVAISKEYKTEY